MGLEDYKAAQRHVGHSPPGRPDHDFYSTCPEAVRSLIEVEDFEKGIIWEPACGNGAISRILEIVYGRRVVSTDLYDYGFGRRSGLDFLADDPPCMITHIVTNPPFKLSQEFAERGHELIEITGGKLCLLNRIQWLEGVKRKKMFDSTSLARVHIFSRRIPRMHRPDYTGKKGTSMIGFAWYVWEAGYTGKPELNWIDWKDYEKSD